ncbi:MULTISPECIES: HNH endonuclease [Pseudanabaena]|uniref:HNH endonuclease n=1 Tax=Pseudanabaena TaxID=1152 RepID=UPI0024789699|nr:MULTISPECIES: HNH endonuclease [Pseudanabaena]MEA5487490.1 HNH endonuclease [Pseudanabaena sp. CCNP1317]WGS74033.1 HNH endonuclease [Pseudanabaena galeata CCNP1313]
MKRCSKVVKEVRNRDDKTCQCCGLKCDIEVHHIHPLVFGGSDTANNAIALCPTCHQGAPNNPDEFLKYQKSGGLRITLAVAKCGEVMTPELQEELAKLRLAVFGMGK